jgi:hypothetical protein
LDAEVFVHHDRLAPSWHIGLTFVTALSKKVTSTAGIQYLC